MNTTTPRRVAAAALALAALLAIAGFTALGSVFDYPAILKADTSEILSLYRQQQGAVTGWFLVLAVSAALLAPAGFYLGRLASGTLGRWIAAIGIAAATVQVIGLSRWVLFVPSLSDDATDPARTSDAYSRFELLHTWLGTILGETIGYALTATFTILVAYALTKGLAPRWMTYLGYASAVLIATGVIIPLGVEPASMSNFIGYITWCLWLLALAVALWRPTTHGRQRSTTPLTTAQPDTRTGAQASARVADESTSTHGERSA
jgi:hypothetical protein